MLPLEQQPSGTFSSAFFRGDEIVCGFANESSSPMVIALDAGTGAPQRALLPAGATVPAAGGEVTETSPRSFESILFASDNVRNAARICGCCSRCSVVLLVSPSLIAPAVAQGDEVQGWLALPDGEEEGPYPTILHTHGGPTSIQMQSFNPAAQAWLDAGFAWCSVNYHGSTDFGSAWEQSICKCRRSLFHPLKDASRNSCADGQLGELEVQDMAGAHRYLVERGVSKPEAIFLQGGSYGGYLTLQGLGVRPELWAGGMGTVAIADW